METLFLLENPEKMNQPQDCFWAYNEAKDQTGDREGGMQMVK